MSVFMKIFNYIAFQVCWLSLIYYGNFAILFLLIYLSLHLLLIYFLDNFNFELIKREFYTLLFVSCIGVSSDTIMYKFGIYNFHGVDAILLPAWYVALWLLYSSTLHHCFASFQNFNNILLASIGAVSAPFIYVSLNNFSNNFEIGQPLILSLFVIALEWFILLPLTIKLAKIIHEYYPAKEQLVKY